jgi:hypothetical protein
MSASFAQSSAHRAAFCRGWPLTTPYLQGQTGSNSALLAGRGSAGVELDAALEVVVARVLEAVV